MDLLESRSSLGSHHRRPRPWSCAVARQVHADPGARSLIRRRVVVATAAVQEVTSRATDQDILEMNGETFRLKQSKTKNQT